MRHISFLCGLCLWASAANVHGDVIVQYTFPSIGGANNETHSSLGPTTTLLGVGATPIADTSGKLKIGTENPSTAYATQPVLRVDFDANTTTPADAIANGVYFSFTVTPDSESLLDLVSLDFVAGRGGAGMPRGFVVRSSADNFATDLLSSDIPTVRPNWTNYSVPLTDAMFQGVTDPITFRFYPYSTNTGATVEFDNITLNGTLSPVPEPGTLLLLGAALGGFALWRRRKTR